MMAIKAMIRPMHLPGCKIRSNSEYSIMPFSGILCSDRCMSVAFTGQSKVRTVNFLKCYVSNRYINCFTINNWQYISMYRGMPVII